MRTNLVKPYVAPRIDHVCTSAILGLYNKGMQPLDILRNICLRGTVVPYFTKAKADSLFKIILEEYKFKGYYPAGPQDRHGWDDLLRNLLFPVQQRTQIIQIGKQRLSEDAMSANIDKLKESLLRLKSAEDWIWYHREEVLRLVDQ